MALSKCINCQPHRTFEPLYTANIHIVGAGADVAVGGISIIAALAKG